MDFCSRPQSQFQYHRTQCFTIAVARAMIFPSLARVCYSIQRNTTNNVFYVGVLVFRQADLEETIARLTVQLEQEREEKKDIISEKALLQQQAQQVLI